MPALPEVFLTTPITHRGLHGPDAPENSLAAARAAIDAGYGIEMDIQPASDGVAMVFHDYDLRRLAGEEVLVSAADPATLATKRLLGTPEGIPTLAQMLELVAGRVPLLIEIKDQDGAMGPNIGNLHNQVAAALDGYEGPVAVMSFNPHIVAAFHKATPHIPVGITSCGYPEEDWPLLDYEARTRLAAIEDFEDTGSSFISHAKDDLTNPRVDALKSQGHAILCWTIRSPAEEADARKIADNITFEGYLAAK